MNIVLDARWIFRELSGIGMYTQELLTQYALQGGGDTYVALFCDPDVRHRVSVLAALDAAPHIRTLDVPYGVFSARNQLHLPRLLAALQADVYHSPNYMVPLFPRLALGGERPRTAVVTTIHDVIPLVVPDHAPRSKKTRLLPLFRQVIRRATAVSDAVVTVSRRSGDDIVRCLRPRPPDKVHVVYNGVGVLFTPAPPGLAPRDPHRVRRLLYVGRADPYKDVATLVRALALLRRDGGPAVELVIAGTRDPRYPQAEQLAHALGLADAVSWTGYLATDQLVEAYRDADVLVHASRYEGFGLQILEAMAAGVPVVAARGGAVPEVAGDAAILLPTGDPDGFAREVRRVLSDDALADRLRRAGQAQAARFRWSATAEGTRAVYRYAAAARQQRGAA